MIFNSPVFVIFLVIVFALYWAPFTRNGAHRNPVLLISSYVFYGWWDWRFLSLILFSSLLDFFLGLRLSAATDQGARKRLLIISMAANLGVLFFFKYFNFFLGSFQDMLGVGELSWTFRIILPVGISFYTFQTMSYCIDIYRRQLEPTKDLLGFMTFVSFFPQLVAGPIERAKDLLPQLQALRPFSHDNAVLGCKLMLIGAFKKMVVADRLAPLVEAIFENQTEFSGLFNVLGAVFFAIQIYCDFSGYSDIAVGTAKLFNVDLMSNFNRPYFALSLREFWARWHISLSTWFRDYVYIPLGGNRGTLALHARNLMVTFVLSGLWHGANWTFIIWGALHGGFLMVERFIGGPLKRTPTLLQWAITMVVVLVGWVFFRAQDISHATEYLGHLVPNGTDLSHQLKRLMRIPEVSPFSLLSTVVFAAFVLVIDKLSITPKFVSTVDNNRFVRYATYSTLVALVLLFGIFTDQAAFIYFQF